MQEIKVAILLRGSTNKQTNKGKLKKLNKMGRQSARPITADDDLPLQREKIMELIKSQPEKNKEIKWILSEYEYIETGVSGFHTHTSKRKGLNNIFKDAKTGLWDMLIVYKLDRLGRRSIESLNYAIKLIYHCRIWVVDKNKEFTNNGDVDEMMNFIEFWAAKKSSIDTKIRVTDMMNIIHDSGYWTGGNPPYGYNNHPTISNMLQIIPKEAEIVKEIYKIYTTEGFGMLKIAGILNEKGEKTRTGKDWSTESIRKILRNSVYKGYLSYGKTKKTEGEFGSYQKYVKEGEESISDKYWKEYDIVGEKTWDEAQRIKKSRIKHDNLFGNKNPSRSGTGKGLLVGILKCECGSNMTYGTTSNWKDNKQTKKNEPYYIYRCLKRLKSGVKACGAEKATYKAKELEQIILDKIKIYMHQMITTDMLKNILKGIEQSSEDINLKISTVKNDIERWNKIKTNANIELSKLLAGENTGFNKTQITELYNNAEKELNKVTALYKELELIKNSKDLSEDNILELKQIINDFPEIYEYATQEEKRRMIQSIVSKIELKGEKILIEINFNIFEFFNNPYLQNDDSRSAYCKHIASILKYRVIKDCVEFNAC